MLPNPTELHGAHMRAAVRTILVASLSIATMFGFTAPAKATPLVAGSTYDIFLEVATGPSLTLVDDKDFSVTVGTPTAFSFNGSTGTISEQQSTLADGTSVITFTILGNAGSDLFPGTNPGAGLVGIGLTDPLNFNFPFDLTAATLQYTNTTTLLSGGGSVLNFVGTPDPFDGSFPSPGRVVGLNNSLGDGLNEVTVTLEGVPVPAATATPEPAPFMLVATGLLGLAGAVRRRIRR
jgi:hypothetical protein